MAYRSEPGGPPVLVVAFGGRVFGMDPATGRRMWEYEPAYRTDSDVRLIVEEERIFALIGNELACLVYPGGEKRWSSGVWFRGSTLLADRQTIYVAGAGEVAAYSRDGKQLWHDDFRGKGMMAAALGFPGRVAGPDAG